MISIIIPAFDCQDHLTRCLRALERSDFRAFEIIVVDDGSRDGTRSVAESFGVQVMSTGGRRGPAFARNLGVTAATHEILFFLDADVCVHPNTLSIVARTFEADPALDALIGSYDFEPDAGDFLSQYRNLMHSFVHQSGSEKASTFWSGCGAIRRELFLEHSGFSLEYGRPAIEDIELGYRLIRAGRKIMLDHDLLVTHLKRWSFWNLLKTDILDRGIPWTELILRDKTMPNDLNLQLSQRVSVALVFAFIGLAATTAMLSGAYLLVPFLFILFFMLARWWGEVGVSRRPRSAFAMLAGMLLLISLLAYSQRMYGLIPLLSVTPVFLFLRHRYDKSGKLRKVRRALGLVFITICMAVAFHYLPAHRLVLVGFAILVALGLLNSQFYLFLAGKRGIPFMLAAIPFHLLYHFYSGISFLIGLFNHYAWSDKERQMRSIAAAARRVANSPMKDPR